MIMLIRMPTAFDVHKKIHIHIGNLYLYMYIYTYSI